MSGDLAGQRRPLARDHSAFEPRRPFTRAEGLAAGLTDRVLGGPRFSRLLHGVYVDARVAKTPELVGLALLLGTPGDAWVSHASAARILGLPLPVLPGEHVSVVTKSGRTKRRDVRSHVGDPAAQVVRRGDLVHSAPEQVFLELSELLTLVDLVVVGDWMVRKELVTLARLRAFVGASRSRAAAAARVAVGFVRERVDSPMETRLRMLFVLAGLPEPEVNLTFDLGDGRRRYDLCWPVVKVIAEYDGRHHAERESQWEADLVRREQIDDGEWRIRVFVARDIYRTPHLTLERMASLLRRQGLGGVPRVLADGWRPHFPIKNGYL